MINELKVFYLKEGGSDVLTYLAGYLPKKVALTPREKILMTYLEVLIEERNRLLSNGKNTEGSGVIRKLNRKIRKLEKK